MSISEKLKTIAQNEQNVYDTADGRGWTRGYTDGYNDGYIAAETEAYQEGMEGERSRFWDVFQENGNRRNYQNAFQYWPDENFKPKYDIVCGSDYAPAVFRYSQLTDVKSMLLAQDVTITVEGTGLTQFAMYATMLTHLPEVGNSSITTMANAFVECRKLQSIDRLVLSNTSACNCNSAFKECNALTDITFSENISPTGLDLQWSPLTHDSLMSLINALADKTGVSGTWSITLGEDNIAKLTAEELDILESKGWTYS